MLWEQTAFIEMGKLQENSTYLYVSCLVKKLALPRVPGYLEMLVNGSKEKST